MKRIVRLWMIPLLMMTLSAIACGGGASPMRPSTPPTSAPKDAAAEGVQGDCGSFLRPGLIAFNGTVVSASQPVGGYPDLDYGWQVINVRVDAAATEAVSGEQGGYSPGHVVAVNLIDPFFPIVVSGDCVAAAGSEREFPCVGRRPLGCHNFGFVAEEFDVLTVE